MFVMMDRASLLAELMTAHPRLCGCRPDLERAIDCVAAAFASNQVLLACGNGGSGADAEHLVGELVKGFRAPRESAAGLQDRLIAMDPQWQALARRLQHGRRAISLTCGPIVAAIANDQHHELIFAQQVLAIARQGDVLIALSTSGNSANVVRAAQVARAVGTRVIAFTGEDGGALAAASDIAIRAPAKETHAVQECHLPLYHTLCAAVEVSD